MHPQDHFFGMNPTRLLLVGLCMALEKARRELRECGHLLFRLNCGRWMGELMEPLALPRITPPLGGGLRRHRCLAAFPVLAVVRKHDSDVHFPASASVRSDCHAHRLYSFGDGAHFWFSQCSRSSARRSTRRRMRITPGS